MGGKGAPPANLLNVGVVVGSRSPAVAASIPEVASQTELDIAPPSPVVPELPARHASAASTPVTGAKTARKRPSAAKKSTTKAASKTAAGKTATAPARKKTATRKAAKPSAS